MDPRAPPFGAPSSQFDKLPDGSRSIVFPRLSGGKSPGFPPPNDVSTIYTVSEVRSRSRQKSREFSRQIREWTPRGVPHGGSQFRYNGGRAVTVDFASPTTSDAS